MSKVTRFEDLLCWKKARLLNKEVYKITEEDKLARGFALQNQIRKASISISANIAEGFSRFNIRDSNRFFDYAQSSAAEVRSLIYLVLDLNLIKQEKASELIDMSKHCQFMILSLIKHNNKMLNK